MLRISLPTFLLSEFKLYLWNFKSPSPFPSVPEEIRGSFELMLYVLASVISAFPFSSWDLDRVNLVKIPLPPLKDQVLERRVQATRTEVTLTHTTLCVLLRLFCHRCPPPPCYLLLLITYFFLHSIVNKVQSNLLPSVASSFSASPKGTLSNIDVNGKEDRTRKEANYCTQPDGLVCKVASPTNGHVVSKTLRRKFLVTLVFQPKNTQKKT